MLADANEQWLVIVFLYNIGNKFFLIDCRNVRSDQLQI